MKVTNDMSRNVVAYICRDEPQDQARKTYVLQLEYKCTLLFGI
jgi:hypothetical protein